MVCLAFGDGVVVGTMHWKVAAEVNSARLLEARTAFTGQAGTTSHDKREGRLYTMLIVEYMYHQTRCYAVPGRWLHDYGKVREKCCV